MTVDTSVDPTMIYLWRQVPPSLGDTPNQFLLLGRTARRELLLLGIGKAHKGRACRLWW